MSEQPEAYRAVNVGAYGYRVVGPAGEVVATFGAFALQYGDGGKAHPMLVPSNPKQKAVDYAAWKNQDSASLGGQLGSRAV